MGVSTCLYLSRHERVKNGSVSVSLVEANYVASGASGKAGGFVPLAPEWYSQGTESLARLSYGLHEELALEFGGDTVYGYRKLQALELVKDIDEKGDCQQGDVSGIYSQPAALDEEPTGIQWLQDSTVKRLKLLTKEDSTAQVDPALFTNTIFEKSKSEKVAYIKGKPISWDENSEMLSISTEHETCSVPCDCLVTTAGPWSAGVVKQLIGVEIPVGSLPGHSILIRPSEAVPPQAIHACLYGKDVVSRPVCFTWSNGLVYIGGENVGLPLPTNGTEDIQIDSAAIEKLINTSKELSKVLAKGAIERKQASVSSYSDTEGGT
ncbi:hypothetical protein M422DRAFT_64893 [Sphaerobolus stellatus SS14]|nr:hypothetical protein M422DRAFT_64893 [Sphaerobolus stellatus SS14]